MLRPLIPQVGYSLQYLTHFADAIDSTKQNKELASAVRSISTSIQAYADVPVLAFMVNFKCVYGSVQPHVLLTGPRAPLCCAVYDIHLACFRSHLIWPMQNQAQSVDWYVCSSVEKGTYDVDNHWTLLLIVNARKLFLEGFAGEGTSPDEVDISGCGIIHVCSLGTLQRGVPDRLGRL